MGEDSRGRSDAPDARRIYADAVQEPDGHRHEPGGERILARVLTAGVFAGGLCLLLAAAYLFVAGETPAAVPGPKDLLQPQTWTDPGIPFLWLTLLILGLTPVAALLGLLIHAARRRQFIDLMLGLGVLLLIAAGSLIAR